MQRMTRNRAPVVTVIVPTFNCSRQLKLALRSLLAQEHQDFEAWVVGDGCTDDSADVVRGFGDPRLQWLALAPNSGSQSVPNNEGLRRARGRYVAYLNHDDLWFPWHLSHLVEFMQRSGCDLAHSLGGSVFEDLVRMMPRRVGALFFACPSSWMHRRDLTDRFGPWKPHADVGWGVDAELLYRVQRNGGHVQCSGDLSLVKFPAAPWRAYTPKAALPQLDYLADMEKDPALLQTLLLLEAAATDARESREESGVAKAVRGAKSLVHGVINCYGRDRWPLVQVNRWRGLRSRRANYVKKGLKRAQADTPS